MYDNVEKLLDSLISSGNISVAAVKAGIYDNVLLEVYRSPDGKVDAESKFDMASVTKVLAATMLSLIAFENGKLSLDTGVDKFYDLPTDKKGLTIYNLLTHTFGMGWKPIYKCKDTGHLAEYILNIPVDFPVGSEVSYSCPGFILLGMILEKVYGMPLDEAFDRFVVAPLMMNNTSYLPNSGYIVNSNLTEELRGKVNDDNCRITGGVRGNAGIFSTMNDMTLFTRMLLNYGRPLVKEETFKEAIKNYTPSMSEARGIGFNYVDESYTQTGKLFKVGSFGHCGHTGQSIFVDPESGLYAIILTDATVSVVKKYGFDKYGEVIKMRELIHNAIKQDLKR